MGVGVAVAAIGMDVGVDVAGIGMDVGVDVGAIGVGVGVKVATGTSVIGVGVGVFVGKVLHFLPLAKNCLINSLVISLEVVSVSEVRSCLSSADRALPLFHGSDSAVEKVANMTIRETIALLAVAVRARVREESH